MAAVLVVAGIIVTFELLVRELDLKKRLVDGWLRHEWCSLCFGAHGVAPKRGSSTGFRPEVTPDHGRRSARRHPARGPAENGWRYCPQCGRYIERLEGPAGGYGGNEEVLVQ